MSRLSSFHLATWEVATYDCSRLLDSVGTNPGGQPGNVLGFSAFFKNFFVGKKNGIHDQFAFGIIFTVKYLSFWIKILYLTFLELLINGKKLFYLCSFSTWLVDFPVLIVVDTADAVRLFPHWTPYHCLLSAKVPNLLGTRLFLWPSPHFLSLTVPELFFVRSPEVQSTKVSGNL